MTSAILIIFYFFNVSHFSHVLYTERTVMNMTENYSKEYISEIYERNVDDVFRLCFSYLKNIHNCEDAVSAVFVRLIKKQPHFSSEKEEKAWLIVTACNCCKDMLRFSLRHPHIDISGLPEQEYWDKTENSELLETVLGMPEKYRAVLYLHFFIGYSLKEIAEITKVNESTIRSRLFYGKKKLAKLIGGNEYEKKIYRNDGTHIPNAGTEK